MTCRMKQRLVVVTFLLALAGATAQPNELNLALFATPATSYVSGHETLDAINDGFEPRNVGDHSHGAYGNWPKTGTQWVQYDWSQPVSTRRWTCIGGLMVAAFIFRPRAGYCIGTAPLSKRQRWLA